MKTIKNLTVEQLRKSILQLAIQGKLVKQDPNDEPASVLVDKIYAEKKRLIAEGKIKKDKVESRIYKGDDNRYYEKIGNTIKDITDDLPFKIPNNWEWIRFENLAQYGMGQTILKKEMFDTGIPVYSATIEDKPLGFIKEENNKVNLQKNDLVIPARGNSIGHVTKINDPFASCTQTTIWMKLYFKELVDYLLCYFKGYKDNIFKFSGAAIPQVTITMMQKYLLPLPPINEQRRITNKILEIDTYIKKYDLFEKQLTELENSITDNLKKSILQYAVEGKLVKQDPNDEPASVLLERIKAEKEKLIKEGKIKRDKNESFIYQGDDKNYYEKIENETRNITDEIPFDIPKNWIWTRVKNISSYGSTLNLNSYQSQKGMWLLELEDIKSSSNIILTRKIITEKTNLESKVFFKTGMILYSKLRPYLDKVIIADADGIATSEIVPFYSFINSNFLITFFRSPYYLNYVKDLMYGVKMPRLGTDDMKKILIPIPSFNEQEKIQNKIIRLFSVIN